MGTLGVTLRLDDLSPQAAAGDPARRGSSIGRADRQALAYGIARGDAAALEAFYNARFGMAMAIAARATGRDEAFCLDVVHDAMLRLMRGVRASLTEEQLDLYLKRCVVTSAIDRIRREQRRRARERNAGGAVSERRADAERMAQLRAAFRSLDEQDRSLLAARFVHDQTLDAAAHQHGLTRDAAHGRIRRALGRLRTILQDDQP